MGGKKPGRLGKRAISNLIVVVLGVLLYMALSNFGAVAGALSWFLSIFSPFVSGLVIAYLLNMPMRFFEARLFARFKRKRGISILTTYLLAVLVLAFLIGMAVPQLVESISKLLGNLSLYLDNLNVFLDSAAARFGLPTDMLDTFMLSYSDLLGQVVDWVRGALPEILNYGMAIGNSVVGALTAVIASIYMLASKEKLMVQGKRVLYAVLPRRAGDETMRILGLSNNVFSGFISGKILDSAIIGAICFVFMAIMNVLSSILNVPGIAMPYSPLISVIIGVTNVIPFFGPFIGAIPSIMILLMVNPWSAVWFTVFIIVLQQFDGNVLGPKILGSSTGLPAMWVLIAIIVGGGLFGFSGMLLGVPTTAVLYTLASDIVEHRLRRKGLADEAELRPVEVRTDGPPPEMDESAGLGGDESAPGPDAPPEDTPD